LEISAVKEALYRPARLDDLADIEAIEATQFADLSYPYFALRQLYDLHGSNWIVAEIEHSVRGYALMAFASDWDAWLVGLGVQEQSQGMGLGSGLVGRALELCRAAMVEQVFVTVRPGNEAAYKLYVRAGFCQVGHDEEYFGTGEPRDVLVHRLAP
jgi:[ribosomal protein S18]-alanine N-acetyltransferase